MKKWLMPVIFATMLGLAACGGRANDVNNDTAGTDNKAADNNNAEETAGRGDGEEVYKENCASCHGDDLSVNVGPALDNVGSDHSVDDIKKVIEDGQGSIPAAIVSGDDEDAVAEWLAEHD